MTFTQRFHEYLLARIITFEVIPSIDIHLIFELTQVLDLFIFLHIWLVERLTYSGLHGRAEYSTKGR